MDSTLTYHHVIMFLFFLFFCYWGRKTITQRRRSYSAFCTMSFSNSVSSWLALPSRRNKSTSAGRRKKHFLRPPVLHSMILQRHERPEHETNSALLMTVMFSIGDALVSAGGILLWTMLCTAWAALVEQSCKHIDYMHGTGVDLAGSTTNQAAGVCLLLFSSVLC